jgi:hypothetical protein
MSSVTPTKILSKRKSQTRSLIKSWRSYKTQLASTQDVLKKYQDNTKEKLKKAQKQLNELIEDFNKHQSEKRETIKKRYMK